MSEPISMHPEDQAERDKFTHVHDRNISLIAPAGVGKTRSIVKRIRQIAQHPDAAELLPRLVVVTYTEAAALEMQGRARMDLREANVPPRVQRAFQQTFFGTIHGFCVRLLSRFGHHLGLPGVLDLVQAEDELWERFLVHGAGRDPVAEQPALRDLFSFLTVDRLYALGRQVKPGLERTVGPLQPPDLRRLLAFDSTGLPGATGAAVKRRQQALAEWLADWRQRGDLREPPEAVKKPEMFVELWTETFAPLHTWLQGAVLEFGRRVANDFAAFRVREGVMTYDDQIRLALAALQSPAARAELGRERWSVLLDEAQDTDVDQFDVLLRVAGLPEGRPEQAEGQSFCLVGDFQQAIWAPRSDLDTYREVHRSLVRDAGGLEVGLAVTFRCDRAIIDFVNGLFAPLLVEAMGQAQFVPLRPRHGAGEGQVIRWTCPPLPDRGRKWKLGERASHEADFLAKELKRLKPAGLAADDWSDVALLCPRVDWLRAMEGALRRVGVDTQLHSGEVKQAVSTPHAWLTALVWVAAFPEDAFEVAGVLRDVFGVSDDAMARFTNKQGELLRLDRTAAHPPGEVAQALGLLRRAGEGIAAMPLQRAVRQLLDRTRLRERVNSLQEEGGLAEAKFDELLAQADRRAAAGATLTDLAHEWRDALGTEAAGSREARPGAVQLYSWHKSKGLEWQTVIVPFLYRSFSQPSPAYPRVEVHDGRQVVYRNKEVYGSEARALIEHRERQQFQRMLYVACTRPRHTLLFINDAAIFAEADRKMPFVPAEMLELDREPARALWESLPSKVARQPRNGRPPEVPGFLIPPRPPLTRADLDVACARARDIPRRVTPHELAHPVAPEAEPERAAEREEPRADSPVLLYGTWFHALMEAVPWERSTDAWDAAFSSALAASPQPARARREWETFRSSELAGWLARPGLLIHRELPFLWPADARWLEGVIDLAVRSPDGAWQVLDWKTNRTTPDGLRAVYRGQVEAYVLALRALLRAPVEGSLYLTATGDWLRLETPLSVRSGSTS